MRSVMYIFRPAVPVCMCSYSEHVQRIILNLLHDKRLKLCGLKKVFYLLLLRVVVNVRGVCSVCVNTIQHYVESNNIILWARVGIGDRGVDKRGTEPSWRTSPKTLAWAIKYGAIRLPYIDQLLICSI